jgi:hypothetical protein
MKMKLNIKIAKKLININKKVAWWYIKNSFWNVTFEQYLINVGIRSSEFTYEDEILFQNVKYFKKCWKQQLSPYKALLFLNDEINK